MKCIDGILIKKVLIIAHLIVITLKIDKKKEKAVMTKT